MTDRNGAAAEIAAHLGALPVGASPVAGVADRLLTLFTSGDLAPGTRLPSERQLAESLGVGRSAIREALAALEILGVVSTRPGSGTYLRDGVSELLPQTLRWGMLVGGEHTEELIEVRAGLEILAARTAAARASDDAIAEMRAAIQRMRDAGDDLHAFVEADVSFHIAVAAASGNRILLDLLQIVRSLLRVWVDRSVNDPAQAAIAMREHEHACEAIASRDPEAAAASMAAHMETASARLTALAAAGR